jgi:Flp pilus assembly protein TadG
VGWLVRDRGSTTIEFALILPVILLVLLAGVEVFVAARLQLDLTHAAREGARVAATTPDVEQAIAAVRRSLGSTTGDSVRVAVDRQHHVGGTARVVVSLRHRVASPLFGGLVITLDSDAVMRVER